MARPLWAPQDLQAGLNKITKNHSAKSIIWTFALDVLLLSISEKTQNRKTFKNTKACSKNIPHGFPFIRLWVRVYFCPLRPDIGSL